MLAQGGNTPKMGYEFFTEGTPCTWCGEMESFIFQKWYSDATKSKGVPRNTMHAH